MLIAALLLNDALGVDAGAAQIGRNVERIGQPLEQGPRLPLQSISKVLGEIGVGALIVDVELDRVRGHLGGLSARCCPPSGCRRPLARPSPRSGSQAKARASILPALANLTRRGNRREVAGT